MKLHLVGGFLGSGKTTAIIAAAKSLLADGQRVGVVTNDQGKYLVDTAFMQLEALPTVEVNGGCFCCNYHDLNDQLRQLIQSINPDVIFAESVGSCADIVATVVKPLLTLGDEQVRPSSFSVFADSRLLLHHLSGEALPFSEDVVYIFEKQIEEAGLLVINKRDLLSSDQVALLQEKVPGNYPRTPYRFQNSLSSAQVQDWLALIQNSDGYLPQSSLEVDYARYGRGEAQMAWLDTQLTLTISEGNPQAVLVDFFGHLLNQIRAAEAAIGHLKFVLQCAEINTKISFTTLDEHDWQEKLPPLPGGEISLLVNARVEMPAEELQQLFENALQMTQSTHAVSFKQEAQAFFHPGEPKPTYRIT